MLGLFSAAFGLGFRPLISDVLTGVFFAFEDTLDIGDKVEIVGATNVEGVVEAVDLRTLHLRGNAGELLVIPNGEIRIIRNFSRGLFSLANVTIKLPSKDLHRALDVLEGLQDEAFFEKVRSTQVVALYNDQLVWRHFGYEGPSFRYGGYINRGFDDLSWLPEPPPEASPPKDGKA